MNFSEKTRNSCALHGALGTLNAIPGVIPVVHATGGCGIHYAQSYSVAGGLSTSGSVWGPPLSSTNIAEKHVVFGGGSRLREQLKNTVKILDADVYAIVTGCATELVGDDIAAMAKEGVDQGFPVVFANTPGFRGTFHNGYVRAVKALLENLPVSVKQSATEAPQKLVNIWGVLPQQDPFWQAHLREIGNLIKALGAQPNILLGTGQKAKNWALAEKAVLNVAVSSWGKEINTWFEEHYGIPGILLDHLPVGPFASKKVLDAISEKLGTTSIDYTDFSNQSIYSFKSILENLRPYYFTDRWQRTAAIVAESATALGIADFLDESLGIEISTLIITDPLRDTAQEHIRSFVNSRFVNNKPSLLFTEDVDLIKRTLTTNPVEIIFGSTLERDVANATGAPLIRVSYPVSDSLIIDRGFAGLSGAVYLIEEIGTALRR